MSRVAFGSEADVRARQLEGIRDAVRYAAKNSRFYGTQFYAAPEIRCWEDFHKLPFTFPGDIKRDPYGFLCISPNEVERIVSIMTSGTTDASKRVFFSAGDMERTVEFFCRGMGYFTEKGDRVAIFMPGGTMGSVGDLLRRGLRRLGAEPTVFGVPESGIDAAGKLLGFGANVAVGLPMDMYRTSISSLSGEIRKRGELKNVLVSADYVPDSLPDIIEGGLGCRVYEHYGMTETCFGGGVFCGERVGYHMRDGDIYFEIVDIEAGEPCAAGRYGEVAVTTFSAEAMPLIRYRTGDVARFRTEKCPCGYEMPIMERVRCRIADIITLPDGEMITAPEIENMILPRLMPESIELTWNENAKKLTVGVWAPKRMDVCSELAEKFENSGAEIEFTETERPVTDRRAMTKRAVKRI